MRLRSGSQHSCGYERLQKSKDSLKACFEYVYTIMIDVIHSIVESQISHFANFTPWEELVPIRHFWQMRNLLTVNFDNLWSGNFVLKFLKCEELVNFFSDVKKTYRCQIVINVKNLYQIITSLKNQCQILTSVINWHQIITCEKLVSKFTR